MVARTRDEAPNIRAVDADETAPTGAVAATPRAVTPPLTEALNGAPQLFEFDQTESPFRDAVIREKLAPEEDGLLAVPQSPGLGITVNLADVARFRVEEIVLR